jgi:hypothetical protein
MPKRTIEEQEQWEQDLRDVEAYQIEIQKARGTYRPKGKKLPTDGMYVGTKFAGYGGRVPKRSGSDDAADKDFAV